MMQEAELIVSQLDVRRAQVLIEAAIVEISDELGEDLGIQLAVGDESGGSTPVAGTNFTNVGRSLGEVLSALLTDSLITPAAGGITVGAGERDKNGVSWGYCCRRCLPPLRPTCCPPRALLPWITRSPKLSSARTCRSVPASQPPRATA